MTKQTENNYNAPKNDSGKWLDAFVLMYTVHAYNRFNNDETVSEPELTTSYFLNALPIANAPYELQGLIKGKLNNRIRNSLKRLVQCGALESSIGCGPSGRDARMYNPTYYAFSLYRDASVTFARFNPLANDTCTVDEPCESCSDFWAS